MTTTILEEGPLCIARSPEIAGDIVLWSPREPSTNVSNSPLLLTGIASTLGCARPVFVVRWVPSSPDGPKPLTIRHISALKRDKDAAELTTRIARASSYASQGSKVPA